MATIEKENARYYKIVCPCGNSYLVEWSKDADKFTIFEHVIEEEKPAPVAAPKKETAPKFTGYQKKGRKLTTCSNCGQTGHQRRTCPSLKAGDAPKEVNESGDLILTEEQFGMVKGEQFVGRSSMDIVHNLNIPVGEVNRAFRSLTYGTYLLDLKNSAA